MDVLGKEAQTSAAETLSWNMTNINDFASFPALLCLCRIFFSTSLPTCTEHCSCPSSPSCNTMPQSPARGREWSLGNLELIKHARDAAWNTMHPQGFLNVRIHIQMDSIHSETARSELLITSEEHRNIWTRRLRTETTGSPLVYVVFRPSYTSLTPFPATLRVSVTAVAPSWGPCWPCSDTAGLGLTTSASPTANKTHREQGSSCSPCRSGCEWGKESHHCTSGRWGPPCFCFPWECESESHPVDTQSLGKSVSCLC